MFWTCFIICLGLGSVIGFVTWARVEGKKGVLIGVIATILFALVFASGITLTQ